MNAFDLFFVFSPAVLKLFYLGYLPQEEDFIELSKEEKVSYFKNNPHTEEKLFRMNIPADDERFKGMTVCVSESEKDVLMRAVKFIDGYGEGMKFANNEEKMHYVASKLPDVYSKGTRFERPSKSNEL